MASSVQMMKHPDGDFLCLFAIDRVSMAQATTW